LELGEDEEENDGGILEHDEMGASLGVVDELCNRMRDLSSKVTQTEFMGLMEYKVYKGLQLVVAQNWPSWGFVLRAAGCSNVIVITRD